MIGFRRLSTLLASFRVLSDSKCSLLSVFAALIFLIHAAMLLATVFPASSSAATSSTTSISGDESVRLYISFDLGPLPILYRMSFSFLIIWSSDDSSDDFRLRSCVACSRDSLAAASSA
jgi:hypothetical protein